MVRPGIRDAEDTWNVFWIVKDGAIPFFSNHEGNIGMGWIIKSRLFERILLKRDDLKKVIFVSDGFVVLLRLLGRYIF